MCQEEYAAAQSVASCATAPSAVLGLLAAALCIQTIFRLDMPECCKCSIPMLFAVPDGQVDTAHRPCCRYEQTTNKANYCVESILTAVN